MTLLAQSDDTPTPTEPDLAALDEGPPVPAEKEAELQSLFDSLVWWVREGDAKFVNEWVSAQVNSGGFWLDLSLIVSCVAFAWLVSWLLGKAYQAGRLTQVDWVKKRLPKQHRKLSPFRLTLVPVLWLTLLVTNSFGQACPILRAFALVITIFVLINLPFRFMRWRLWTWFVATTVFVIVALHITGLLDETCLLLDSWALTFGEARISAFDVLKGFLTFASLFWLAGQIVRITKVQLDKNDAMEPSLRVLFRKTTRVILYIFVILITISVMGIDITAISIFGGALGLGIGFGLQKVISNLVSGIILLLDKSIKPGDVVEIDGTYGWINQLNMRYASIVTRDNKEYLVPNEDLITNQVINWSYSNRLVRVRAPIGVSYDSDVRKAIEVAEAAASRVERVQKKPPPACRLIGFGDSAVDLEIRFWIDDPTDGVKKVRSEVLLEIWDAFHEHGIEFPFPQRDLHIRSGAEYLLPQSKSEKD
ncbi:MAG: mechanosensitive ion channel domain-containing protein [Verrucomicrobiota bacterium]